MATIPTEPLTVKRLKLRNTLSDGVRKATYRAICHHLHCDWSWTSDVDPHEPRAARLEAEAHRDTYLHSTEVVYDILGLHDTRYLPRGEAQLERA